LRTRPIGVLIWLPNLDHLHDGISHEPHAESDLPARGTGPRRDGPGPSPSVLRAHRLAGSDNYQPTESSALVEINPEMLLTDVRAYLKTGAMQSCLCYPQSEMELRTVIGDERRSKGSPWLWIIRFKKPARGGGACAHWHRRAARVGGGARHHCPDGVRTTDLQDVYQAGGGAFMVPHDDWA
jgi:hypothetical protein